MPAPKNPRPDSPQAVIQAGALGFYPAHAVAWHALAQGVAQVVVGYRDDAYAQALRQQETVVLEGVEVLIGKKVYAGLGDAFYRGRLPEVLVIAAPAKETPRIADEILEYVEKLCSLGFLGPESGQHDLDQCIPGWVIAVDGMVFEALTRRFTHGLGNIAALSARLRERLLQKLCRGVLTQTGPTLTLHLAGAKTLAMVQTAQVLEKSGLATEMNPDGEHGVLALELALAKHRIVDDLLPALSPGASPLAAQLAQELERLQAHLGILSPVPLGPLALPSPPPNLADMALLQQLGGLAQAQGLGDLAESLSHLSMMLQAVMEAPAALSPEASEVVTLEDDDEAP